jgi:hypothetical protein
MSYKARSEEIYTRIVRRVKAIWLDNITRDLLSSRTFKHYIDELSVTYSTTAIRMLDSSIGNFGLLGKHDTSLGKEKCI